MKERSKHITLIHKNLTGTLSAEEQETLNQWLSESKDNQQTADELKLVWDASDAYFAESTPDITASLARLKSNINKEEVAKPKPVMRYLLRVAAVAALVAGMFFIWNNLNNNSSNEIVQTRAEEQTDLMLEDGSLVFLNEDSRLEKPLMFNPDSRQISLKGEAFFDIAEDVNRPFTVTTQNFDVEVLGTAFNIFAPDNSLLQEVVVDHGKVKVNIQKTNQTYLLEDGDRLLYNTQSNTIELSKDDLQNAQSWRTGRLVFNQTPLDEVFFILEKHFDIEIKCKKKEMLNCTFTVTAFEDADVDVVMETLKTAFDFKLKNRKGSDTYQLSSGSCK